MDLFVYGTLMDPERVRGLLGHPLDGEAATLAGYRRATLARLPYPFAVPQAGEAIDGVLLRRLSAEDVARLDRYEGVDDGLFVRREVRVETAAGPATAWIYLGGESLLRRLSSQ